MKELYNEGRVVGLSAWEIYVRNLLAADPTAQVPTEQEWLSQMTSSGRSMILKIESGTSAGYHDYVFPESSSIWASQQIYGSIFLGECKTESGSNWASMITSYSDSSIPNNDSLYPETPGSLEDVPHASESTDGSVPYPFSHDERQACMQYAKILDGHIIQPGEWVDSELSEVHSQLKPSMNDKPFVRLRFARDITHDFYILLNGFLQKDTVYDYQSSLTPDLTPAPYNGDFLGSACFPWAVKIQFMITSDVQYVVEHDQVLYSDQDNSKELGYYAVVDMKSNCSSEDIKSGTDLIDEYNQLQYSDRGKTCKSLGNLEVNSDEDQTQFLQLRQESNRDEEKFYPNIYASVIHEDDSQDTVFPVNVSGPGSLTIFKPNNDNDGTSYDDSQKVSENANDFAVSHPGAHGMSLSNGMVKMYNAFGYYQNWLHPDYLPYPDLDPYYIFGVQQHVVSSDDPNSDYGKRPNDGWAIPYSEYRVFNGLTPSSDTDECNNQSYLRVLSFDKYEGEDIEEDSVSWPNTRSSLEGISYDAEDQKHVYKCRDIGSAGSDITMKTLLKASSEDAGIDVLGSTLKHFRNDITEFTDVSGDISTIGTTNYRFQTFRSIDVVQEGSNSGALSLVNVKSCSYEEDNEIKYLSVDNVGLNVQKFVYNMYRIIEGDTEIDTYSKPGKLDADIYEEVCDSKISREFTITLKRNRNIIQVVDTTSSSPVVIANSVQATLSDVGILIPPEEYLDLPDADINIKVEILERKVIRLYISDQEPDDNNIPDGSIGIGW